MSKNLKHMMINRFMGIATNTEIPDASYNQLWEDLFEHISYVQLVSPLLISDYKTGKFKLSQLAIKYRISYYQAQRIKAKIDD